LGIFGQVFTVESFGDLLPIINAIETAPENTILLISTNGSQKAVSGEIFATAASKRGIKGIILDGYCRDISGISNTQLPFFAKGVYPQAGTKKIAGHLGKPISISGHLVHSGDYVLADESGLIIMSEEEIKQLLPIAQSIAIKEKLALEILQAEGTSLKDILNFQEHLTNINSEKCSELQWTVD
jgi:regulator of RNase E activity RraA